MAKRTISLTIDGVLWESFGTEVKNKSEGVEGLIRSFLTTRNKENPKLAAIKQEIRKLETAAVDVEAEARLAHIAKLKEDCCKFMVFYNDQRIGWNCSTDTQNEILTKAAMLGVELKTLLADEIANGKTKHIGVKWEELESTRIKLKEPESPSPNTKEEGEQPDQPAT